MCKKDLYVASAVFVLVASTVMFFSAIGFAGSLEPSAAPAPTMKTLDQIPSTWSQKIPGAQRFEQVLDGDAVLDKETGLVWDRYPNALPMSDWGVALNHCYAKNTGGRKGWHLPTMDQLASLVDISVAGYPKLPEGHPFTSVQSSSYWTANTDGGYDSTYARILNFLDGVNLFSFKTSNANYAWCVRSGQSHDAY